MNKRLYIYIYIYRDIYMYIYVELPDDSSRMKQAVVATFFEVKTILFALSIWYRALFGISLTKTLLYIYIYI